MNEAAVGNGFLGLAAWKNLPSKITFQNGFFTTG